MAGPDTTLQTVLHAVRPSFWARGTVSPEKRKVLRALQGCGSGRFGYSVLRCRACLGIDFVPRGCHNRNCPTCRPAAAAAWIAEQEAKLLPTPYFHLVTTLPPQLRDLALVNQRVIYDLLMQASKDTVLTFFRNRKPLGGVPSLLQVLHTWNQRLDHHPHVHSLVSGGAFDEQRQEWIPCQNPKFLFYGPAMAKVLRGKFIEGLQQLRERGMLDFQPELVSALASEENWRALIDALRAQNWNVHIKRPFGGPRQVVRYLARYTHRTAISNGRILRVDKGLVTFSYTDRKAGRKRTRTLPVDSFVTLFAIHIPPKGFRRIRPCGLIAPNEKELFRSARLAAEAHPTAVALEDPAATLGVERPKSRPCPSCGGTDRDCLFYLLPGSMSPCAVRARHARAPPPQGGAANSTGVAA